MQQWQELLDWGWSSEWAAAFEAEPGSASWLPARVTEGQRGAFRLIAPTGPVWAELSGRLVYTAAGPEELPAVGDWVAVAPREDGRATIHAILPRRTALIRKAPERPSAGQVLASNLDFAWIVTSANRDFNPRRIERTLALVRESGAEPVVVLSKCDLLPGPECDAERLLAQARRAAPDTSVCAVSALEGRGLEALSPWLVPGRTGVLIGSSGVGKSTLLNRLLGRDVLATREIRADDDRGRHTTTHREMLPVPGGGVLIDTPGLRELALWADEQGSLEEAFPEIAERARGCRFNDCRHQGEPGCAVGAAIDSGELSAERLASLAKLEREAQRITRQREARGRHEQRKEARRFSKSVRRAMKSKRPDRGEPD